MCVPSLQPRSPTGQRATPRWREYWGTTQVSARRKDMRSVNRGGHDQRESDCDREPSRTGARRPQRARPASPRRSRPGRGASPPGCLGSTGVECLCLWCALRPAPWVRVGDREREKVRGERRAGIDSTPRDARSTHDHEESRPARPHADTCTCARDGDHKPPGYQTRHPR